MTKIISTFQDLEQAKASGTLETFLAKLKNDFLGSAERATMLENERYYDGQDPLIKPMIAKIRRAVLDTGVTFNATTIFENSIKSEFAKRLVSQPINRLFTNPVQITDKLNKDVDLKEKLGEDADATFADIATMAAVHGVCYAYWAGGHVEAFLATDYYPLRDQRTGAHMAGIRLFQIDPDYPVYLQLFEVDGFTEWEIKNDKLINEQKTPYRYSATAWSTHTVIESIENYPGFPIVPWYVNSSQKSLIKRSIKDKISMYNLTETMYFDDFIRTSPLYWAANGGHIEDIVQQRQQIDALRIATVGEGREIGGSASIGAVTVDFPYQAKEALRMEIEAAIFRDGEVVNTQAILAGRILVGAVRMAARAEDNLIHSIERFAKKAIRGIMRIAGIDGEVKFQRTTYTDDLEIMQQAQIAVNADVPVEAVVPVMPLFADRVEETLEIVRRGHLGMNTQDEPTNDGAE